MKSLRPLFTLFLALALTACGTTQTKTTITKNKVNKNTMSTKLKLTQINADLARQALENHKTNAPHELKNAEDAIKTAKRKLDNYLKFKVKIDIENKEQALKQMKEGLQDSVEELRQLEMMYKDQDLADQTREYVIDRGKRRVANVRKRIEFAERDLQHFKEVTQPDAIEALKKSLADKTLGLEKLKQKHRSLALSLEKKVIETEEALDKLRKKSPGKTK